MCESNNSKLIILEKLNWYFNISQIDALIFILNIQKSPCNT